MGDESDALTASQDDLDDEDFCDMCEDNDCHICPFNPKAKPKTKEDKLAVRKKVPAVKAKTPTTGDKLLKEHFSKMVDTIKESEKRMKVEADENKALREELKAYMEKNKLEYLMGEEFKAVLRPMSKTELKSGKALFDAIGIERFLTVAKVGMEQARNNLTQQEFDKHFVTSSSGKVLKIV